jgi:hypothetical protein
MLLLGSPYLLYDFSFSRETTGFLVRESAPGYGALGPVLACLPPTTTQFPPSKIPTYSYLEKYLVSQAMLGREVTPRVAADPRIWYARA